MVLLLCKIAIVLLIAVLLSWFLKIKISEVGMISCAKVVGPAFSVSATGTVGKTFTYGIIRGIQYVREWFSPYNPKTAKQVNLREAFTIGVKEWQNDLIAGQKAAYIAGAKGTKNTGFSLFMGRCQEAYIDQKGVDIFPTNLTVTDEYPSEVFEWHPL